MGTAGPNFRLQHPPFRPFDPADHHNQQSILQAGLRDGELPPPPNGPNGESGSLQYDYRNSNYDFYDYYNPGIRQSVGPHSHLADSRPGSNQYYLRGNTSTGMTDREYRPSMLANKPSLPDSVLDPRQTGGLTAGYRSPYKAYQPSSTTAPLTSNVNAVNAANRDGPLTDQGRLQSVREASGPSSPTAPTHVAPPAQWARHQYSSDNRAGSPSSTSSPPRPASSKALGDHRTGRQTAAAYGIAIGSGYTRATVGSSGGATGAPTAYRPFRSSPSVGLSHRASASHSNRSSRSLHPDDRPGFQRSNSSLRNSGYIDPRTAPLDVGIDTLNLARDTDEDLFLHENESTTSAPRTMGYHPATAASGGSIGSHGNQSAVALTSAAAGAAGAATAAAGLGASQNTFVPPGSSGGLSADKGGSPVAMSTIAGLSPPMDSQAVTEKSEFMKKHDDGKRRRKCMCILFCVIVFIIVAVAITAGVATTVLKSKKNDNGSSASTGGGLSAGKDTSQNGDLNKNSAEIKALLNNKNLHKVFPGVDYTPLHSQYPDCLTWPPSQNNVTRDLAVISQMTNRIRLYGNDCNQTEMVLHAIDRLGLKPTSSGAGMTVWMGVWLDKNTTTNTRQMNKLWTILDEYGSDPFDGVVVGNEVLFRKDLTETGLISTLQGVRTKLKAGGYTNMKLATSDLGSKWTTPLTKAVDVVMSNVHPFFGGVPAGEASGWTWNFWNNVDIPLTQGDTSKVHSISEVGWPSTGGNNCGPGVSCPNSQAGSVAGIEEMNDFMNHWVCEALKNGTDYFWFEAFDEPWKVIYNTADEQWEDKWGLMDVDRNLKDGVKIPDCGGKTV